MRSLRTCNKKHAAYMCPEHVPCVLCVLHTCVLECAPTRAAWEAPACSDLTTLRPIRLAASATSHPPDATRKIRPHAPAPALQAATPPAPQPAPVMKWNAAGSKHAAENRHKARSWRHHTYPALPMAASSASLCTTHPHPAPLIHTLYHPPLHLQLLPQALHKLRIRMHRGGALAEGQRGGAASCGRSTTGTARAQRARLAPQLVDLLDERRVFLWCVHVQSCKSVSQSVRVCVCVCVCVCPCAGVHVCTCAEVCGVARMHLCISQSCCLPTSSHGPAPAFTTLHQLSRPCTSSHGPAHKP